MSEKLEQEFEKALNDTLVEVYSDKSFHLAREEVIKTLASFLATNSIEKVFESISAQEKKGFNDEEISLRRMSVWDEYNSITFNFKLPSGATITKDVKTIKAEDMDKQTFLKYKSIIETLKARQENLKRKAQEEYEKAKEERERLEKQQEIERKAREYDKIKEEKEMLEEEVEMLKRIIKKKISEDEIQEQEEEEDELTEEEKEYLRKNVFDC